MPKSSEQLRQENLTEAIESLADNVRKLADIIDNLEYRLKAMEELPKAMDYLAYQLRLNLPTFDRVNPSVPTPIIKRKK